MDTSKLHALGHLGAQTFRVGDITVTALSDGYLPIGPDLLQGISPEDYAAVLSGAFVPQNPHHTGVNGFLVESDGQTIMVDVGTGPAMGPDLGRMGATLATLGVDPAGIDMVIATHLHPDHIGGAGLPEGNPYSRAELVAHQADIDMWCSQEIRDGAPDDFKPFFDLARGAVESFGERVRPVADGASVAPCVTVEHLPGHTPGHMGVRLESGGQQLLIWADIVHVPAVQFANPDVTIAFDADPDAARATRARVLDMVATDRLWVAGSHIGFPGHGHLEPRSQGGYRFIPALWPYA